MPPRIYARIVIAVLLAAGATVLAAQVLSLPWTVLSLLAMAGVIALRGRQRS